MAGDLPGQAIAWQDRPGLLDTLVATAAGGGTTVVAAVAGQRGVGKTQLAAAYARLRVQHGWPVLVWANAGSEQGIITALDELAAAAGLRGPGDDPRMRPALGCGGCASIPGRACWSTTTPSTRT